MFDFFLLSCVILLVRNVSTRWYNNYNYIIFYIVDLNFLNNIFIIIINYYTFITKLKVLD